MPAGKKRKYRPLNPSDSDSQQQSTGSEQLNKGEKPPESETTDPEEE